LLPGTLRLLWLPLLRLGMLRRLSTLLRRLLGPLWLRMGLGRSLLLLLWLLNALLGLLPLLLLWLLSALLGLLSLLLLLLRRLLRALWLLRVGLRCALLRMRLLSRLLPCRLSAGHLLALLLLSLFLVVLCVSRHYQSRKQADCRGTAYTRIFHVRNSHRGMIQARRVPSWPSFSSSEGNLVHVVPHT
jgi:hypothetical protein